MASDHWIFFTDLFGKQQWLQLDFQKNIIAESDRPFENKQDCLADAKQHGYVERQKSRTGFAYLAAQQPEV